MEKRSSNYLNEKKIIIDDSDIVTILKEEFFYLQRTIDSYDQKALFIKAWSISFSLAVFSTGTIKDNFDLFLLGGISSLLFWVLETYWKIFQRIFLKRARKVEMFLNGKAMNKFRLLDIVGTFDNETEKELKNSWFKIMFLKHVYLPHLIIFVLGLLLWLIDQN